MQRLHSVSLCDALRSHRIAQLSRFSFHAMPCIPPRRLFSAAQASVAPSKKHLAHKVDTETPLHRWPVSRLNTILNICPEGRKMIVERLGSVHRVYSPGWFVSLPVIDRIAYCVDMREQTVYYPPQNAVTKDNVTVRVDAVIFVKFVDALKAAYGATDPLRSVQELAKSAMRAAVGELELDALFHSRKYVNERVSDAVTAAASNWGLIITRHEILDVKPDMHILEVMDKQAAAERMRRERVLEAEGEKQAATLKSEGVRIRLVNESEGHLTRVKNEAMAEQSRLKLEAEGRAKAITAEAEARSTALKMMAKAFREEGAFDAARLSVAREYVSMYGEMGRESNTMIINEKPADVAALLAQATMALQKHDK